MEDVVSTQPNSEFVPVNAQWDAETVTVQAGRPSRRPGASMNAPITLSSTYVHTSELGYGRDGNQTWADRKSTRLNSSHVSESRMPSSA